MRRNTRDAATPMHPYRTVHTGPKIRSGGVQGGRSIFLYQPPALVAGMTKAVPLQPPMMWQAAQATAGGRAARREEEEREEGRATGRGGNRGPQGPELPAVAAAAAARWTLCAGDENAREGSHASASRAIAPASTARRVGMAMEMEDGEGFGMWREPRGLRSKTRARPRMGGWLRSYFVG